MVAICACVQRASRRADVVEMPFVDRKMNNVLYCGTYDNGVSNIKRLIAC
jgi:hypothetical protein